ncbi:Protein SCO2, mitochondrial [Thelohanellus kitauei]|uniref:Protein SCO2, mitochondrial n=1 Tax=Thelohanellus kitauei TaxID=669202 RepID=A0A0C2JLX6_THEKT|nr:Protein SCO2, mitochondrial [Thelohanellus kitauei]
MIRVAYLAANKLLVPRYGALVAAREAVPLFRSFRTFSTSQGRHDEPDRPPVIRYKTAKIIVILGVVVTCSLFLYMTIKRTLYKKELQKTYSSVSHLKIGGPFDMVDHNGNVFTEKDIEGKFCLFYFGFVHCPDICPETLERITEIMNHLPPALVDKYVRCIFVTVDPNRDTPQLMKKYISEFHPQTIGLTGDKEQVDHIKESFRAYSKISLQVTPDDYIVDHSVGIYLVGPDGFVWTTFIKDRDVKEAAKQIEFIITDYLKNK